jgi:hypothetical protein
MSGSPRSSCIHRAVRLSPVLASLAVLAVDSFLLCAESLTDSPRRPRQRRSTERGAGTPCIAPSISFAGRAKIATFEDCKNLRRLHAQPGCNLRRLVQSTCADDGRPRRFVAITTATRNRTTLATRSAIRHGLCREALDGRRDLRVIMGRAPLVDSRPSPAHQPHSQILRRQTFPRPSRACRLARAQGLRTVSGDRQRCP